MIHKGVCKKRIRGLMKYITSESNPLGPDGRFSPEYEYTDIPDELEEKFLQAGGEVICTS